MGANGVSYPTGNPFTRGKDGNLVQSVKEEEQAAPFQEALAKAFVRLQVRVLELFLNKGVKPLVQAL